MTRARAEMTASNLEFWKIHDSSIWQDDSFASTLHDSLFKSHGNVKIKRKMQRDKIASSDKKCSSLGNAGADIKKDFTIGPKKKQRKRKRRQDRLSSGDEISFQGVSSGPEEKVSKLSSKSSDGPSMESSEVGKSDEFGYVVEQKRRSGTLEDQPKQTGKKKRKRKAKKNKFKDASDLGDTTKECPRTENDSRGQNSTERINDSHIYQDGNKSISEKKLSRKERRKLKRKVSRQQNNDVSLNPNKRGKSAAIEDSSSRTQTLHSQDRSMEEGLKGEDEESPSREEEGNQLILVKSRTSREKPSMSLRSQMESQLKSSQFRFLNEQLYKVSGGQAKEMFADDEESFLAYHEGFTQQVEHWPVNPVDIIIDALKKRPASLMVGDFGCGDAKIARSVQQKVHSFDLYAINSHVTVCDISKVPLGDESLDVAVFCLSLMGTNWMEYVREANRVLKAGGLLKVAEVASRFTSLPAFLSAMKSLGFHLKQKDVSNKMFFLLDFKRKQRIKALPSTRGNILKPCLYKKR